MIPRTLLSLIHHSTVPRYRDEMHHDLQLGFRRFDLDASIAMLDLDPSVIAEVRSRIDAIDGAAYLRRFHGTVFDAELKHTIDRTFASLATVLAHEVARGVTAPDQEAPPGAQGRLLAALYFLVYSSEYRARNGAKPPARWQGDAQLVASWAAVRSAIDAGGGTAAALKLHTENLCLALATEMNDELWPLIW